MNPVLRKCMTLSALLFFAARGAICAPSDIVPRGSGLYDAVAILAQKNLLPPGSPDVNSLLGVTGKLYTRADFATAIQGITDVPTEPRAVAALAFARNLLAPELDTTTVTSTSPGSTLAATGFVEPEAGGHTDTGSHLSQYGSVYGRGRLLGSIGRDGAFTISATNITQQTRNHDSFTTRNGGLTGGDNPGVLSGIDEAYATALGRSGLRVTLGYLRHDWGSGYRGQLQVSDNSKSTPTLEVEFPFSLGHNLGAFNFTQFESIYTNEGTRVYHGGRRLEHTIGDRAFLSIEETYAANQFRDPGVLVLPYYAYQHTAYTNSNEPNHFNYNVAVGLSVLPEGPSEPSRLYGQFFVDDLQSPKGLGLGNRVPRKIAYLVGAAKTFMTSGTDIVAEYTHIDPETYTKTNVSQVPLAWFYDSLPLGHPVGPNGNELFVRLGQRLSDHLDFSIAARDRRRVTNNFPAPNEKALDLAFSYKLSGSQSVGLRYTDYREEMFTGVSSDPTAGGADTGQNLRRKIVGVSFLQGF